MTKQFGTAALSILIGLGAAQAQVGTDGRTGSGNAVGQKEAYPANDPSRTGVSGTEGSIPGRRGAGASVGEKETYRTQDPSRTGGSHGTRSPASAGSIGDTGEGR